jgi:hypothetical protein
MRDSGLAYAKPHGCGGEAAQFRHQGEDFQLGESHEDLLIFL